MSNNVPWSINAVEPHTWDTARDAARRSGLSVGEWLEAAIRGNANEREYSRPSPQRGGDTSRLQSQLDDISDRLDRMMDGDRPRGARANRQETAIIHSIDGLTDRIDSLIGEIRADDQGTPYQIKTAIDRLDSRLESLFTQNRNTSAREPDIERRLSEIVQQIGTMDRRIEQENARYVTSPRSAPSIAELDSAIAEITVRQAALDDGAHSRDLDRKLSAIDQRFGFVPRSDVQLAGIEQQIKSLADEMQALRRTSTHSDAVDQLRRDVGDLARMLGDLTPRRSIDALERTVAGLARRIDRAPFAEEHEDNGQVVHALQEIHRSLAEVKPAESFTAVERDLKTLSEKLDGLSERGIDGATIGRLQSQTSEIRDLLSNALPGDALKTLVDQIETLMQRMEHAPSPNEGALMDVVASLERRIDDFAERVETASRTPASNPLLDEIKSRLEQIEGALERGDRGAPGGLEATMQGLLDKLDSAEQRLSKLGAIEHGMNDLFGQMKEIRANAMDVVERASRAPASAPSSAPDSQSQIPTRQAEPREPAPVTRMEPKLLAAMRDMEPVKPAAPAARSNASEPRSIALDPETATVSSSSEADFPLEPGSGSPRSGSVQSAVDRVAQSEAALGGMPLRSTNPSSTADYIAAARRAAQAASKQPEVTESKGAKPGKKAAAGGGSRRPLVLGLLFVLITFGAVRYTGLGNMIPFIHSGARPEPEPLSGPAKKPSDAQNRSENLAPGKSEPVGETPAKAMLDKESAVPTAGNLTVAGVEPKMTAPSLTSSLLSAEIDPVTTGSIDKAKPAKAQNKVIAATPAASSKHAELPPSIGTTGLRMAALSGDPAAAYEIGNRWFDGRGVGASTSEAKHWFEFAYAQGSIPAAYRLGNIYEKGFGTPKNLSEARRYYIIAAEAGNAKAMHNLAVIAAEGGEDKPDYKLAARWFRMAADRNVRDSQYNLGVLYARGFGVEKNFAESYRWFALAGAQGDTDSIKKRDGIAKHLDAQALTTVKIAVREWKPVPLDEAANEVKPRPEWDKAEAKPAPRHKKTAKR